MYESIHFVAPEPRLRSALKLPTAKAGLDATLEALGRLFYFHGPAEEPLAQIFDAAWAYYLHEFVDHPTENPSLDPGALKIIQSSQALWYVDGAPVCPPCYHAPLPVKRRIWEVLSMLGHPDPAGDNRPRTDKEARLANAIAEQQRQWESRQPPQRSLVEALRVNRDSKRESKESEKFQF